MTDSLRSRSGEAASSWKTKGPWLNAMLSRGLCRPISQMLSSVNIRFTRNLSRVHQCLSRPGDRTGEAGRCVCGGMGVLLGFWAAGEALDSGARQPMAGMLLLAGALRVGASAGRAGLRGVQRRRARLHPFGAAEGGGRARAGVRRTREPRLEPGRHAPDRMGGCGGRAKPSATSATPPPPTSRIRRPSRWCGRQPRGRIVCPRTRLRAPPYDPRRARSGGRPHPRPDLRA